MNPKSTDKPIPTRTQSDLCGGAAPEPAPWRGNRRSRVSEPAEVAPTNTTGAWAEVHTADELTDLVESIVHPILVAFEDRQCHHYRAQRALLSRTWHQLGWQVTTLRVDGGRLTHVAERFKILGLPTFLVFSRGEVVDRLPGRRDAHSIIRRLSRLTGFDGADLARDASNRLRPHEASQRCFGRFRVRTVPCLPQ